MIAEIGTALAVAKSLREINDRIKDAEIKSLLADLQLALAEIKVRCAELEEDNLRLKGDLSKAKQVDDVRQNVYVQEGLYYLKQSMPGRSDGPYCPRCLDTSNRLQMLSEASMNFKPFGKWKCPACDKYFGEAEF